MAYGLVALVIYDIAIAYHVSQVEHVLNQQYSQLTDHLHRLAVVNPPFYHAGSKSPLLCYSKSYKHHENNLFINKFKKDGCSYSSC